MLYTPETEEKRETAAAEKETDIGKTQRPKKLRIILGRVLMILGALLLLSAAILYSMNQKESQDAGNASAQMLPDVQQIIQEKVSGQEQKPASQQEHINPYDEAAVEESKEMTVWSHNGWNYIGYLHLPTLDMELPVLSEWSFYNLGMAPCRHMGSTKSDDLVICAHNFPSHFGHLHELSPGDEVSFVDMDGVLSKYQVVTVSVIKPTDVALVKDPALDLVLYTCTYGGQNRIMAGCQRVEE